jgi:hypothetical protein
MFDLTRVESSQGESRSLGHNLLVGSAELMHVIAIVCLGFSLEYLDDEVLCCGTGFEERLDGAIGVGSGAPGGRFEEGLVGFDEKLHGQGSSRVVLVQTKKKEAGQLFVGQPEPMLQPLDHCVAIEWPQCQRLSSLVGAAI